MASNIKRNLEKNGFPANPVALPLERLYESAHRDGINFNKVLEALEADGVTNSKTAEKIIFSQRLPEVMTESDSPVSGLNLDALKNMDFKNLNMDSAMSKASEMMKSMSPSQLSEIKKMYDNMSADERAKLMDMAKSMMPGR